MTKIGSAYVKYRFLLLLITLLALLVLTPLLGGESNTTYFLNLFFSITLLSSVSYLSTNKAKVLLGFLFATPYFIDIWSGHHIPWPHYDKIALGFAITYYLFVLFLLLKHIFEQKDGGLELIFAALSGFLLIGITWSLIFALIYKIDPSSFADTIFTQGDVRYTFVYYSFVTLSTLGYGDIHPQSAIAQSWAILEAIIGQMYMVVLVAGLVGKVPVFRK